jgi:hypothetical protein
MESKTHHSLGRAELAAIVEYRLSLHLSSRLVLNFPELFAKCVKIPWRTHSSNILFSFFSQLSLSLFERIWEGTFAVFQHLAFFSVHASLTFCVWESAQGGFEIFQATDQRKFNLI